MQTLSLYNESFWLISMKLQKKSHYIISLKMCVVKKIRCNNNCSSYLRATWVLSRLLVLGRLIYITVNFWQTITFVACDRARVVTRLCPGCHSSKSIGFSAIHRYLVTTTFFIPINAVVNRRCDSNFQVNRSKQQINFMTRENSSCDQICCNDSTSTIVFITISTMHLIFQITSFWM